MSRILCCLALVSLSCLASAQEAPGSDGSLAYTATGASTWLVETKTSMEARATSPDQDAFVPPPMESSQRLLLQETAAAMEGGSLRVSLQVLSLDQSMGSSSYSSHLTYGNGRADRTVTGGTPASTVGWDEILESIPRRPVFAEPIQLELRPNGEMPGLADLPSQTLNSIPGQYLPTVLSYLHPLLPAKEACPGMTWEAPAPQEEFSDSPPTKTRWTVERLTTGAGSPLAVLRGRGPLRSEFSMVDLTDMPVSATISGEFSAKVRFDLSRHVVTDAHYTKVSEARYSSATPFVMSITEKGYPVHSCSNPLGHK